MLSNPNTIDIVVDDQERHRLLLIMTEERPWNTVAKSEVIAKVSTYRNYALSDQLNKENPGFTASDVVIKIVSNFEPSPKAQELFEQLREDLKSDALGLEWEVLPMSEDPEFQQSLPPSLPSSMPRQELETLETWFFRCSRINRPGKQGAGQLLEILRSTGGQFLRPIETEDSDIPVWKAHPDPAQEIAEEGAFSISDFAHPLLGRSLYEPATLRNLPATCSLSYRPDINC